MAKVEMFRGSIPIINLTSSVGEGANNMKEDVMAVQAMLMKSLEEHPHFSGFEFPYPTGVINRSTVNLIRGFQRCMRKRGKRLSIDGRIDSATADRPGGRREWTIFLLNNALMESYLLSGGLTSNHIESLCRRFPQLFPAIKNIPMGTLELSLEPSSAGIGSFGLTLE